MNDNISDDKLDQILRRAFAAPPIPDGLEVRVGCRVRRSERRRKVALIGSLCSIAASVLLTVHSPNQPARPALPQSRLLVPVRMYVAPLNIKRASRRHVRPTIARLPKLDVFPTPSPLSTEEQALVSLVRNHPVEAAQVFEQMRAASDSPIHIEPLRIEPLPVGEKQ